jgi:hypothetical protein
MFREAQFVLESFSADGKQGRQTGRGHRHRMQIEIPRT